MAPTIREKVLHCSRLFNSVSAESEELQDVSQHFVNWYSNIAAHRAGPASLDERLRDAPDVRAAILRFLDILISMFEDYKFDNTNRDIDYSSKRDNPLDILVYRAASSKPITLMNKVIDCLKRITIAIRAPASVDRYKKAQNVDIDFYRPTDRNHIMELFPAVGPILGDRLLEAVLSRRRFLRYTEDHRMKLGHKSSFQNSQDVGEGIDAGGKSEFADTVATPIFPETPLNDDSPMGLSYNDDEVESIYSSSSSVYSSSSSTRSGMIARAPSMPPEGQSGKPFECPCCFLMIEAKNKKQWERHVMADMRSYVCTFADCKVPDLLFPSRHAWYSHEIAFHRRKWFCISSCSLQFDSRESFDSHIKAIHVSLLRTADAETHGAYSRQLPTQQATSCPFCGEDLQDAKRAKSHIGHHQEQLGLWPLRTMREFEDDDNQQEGDDEEANGEVDGSESEDKEEEMGERQGLEKKIIADGKPFQHIAVGNMIVSKKYDRKRLSISKYPTKILRTLEEERKKKRRGSDDENSKLSIPGDEATEISRISVPSDEATVFSVEDSEDWDSSPGASTRKSFLAGSEMSTSSRRSTRLRRPRSSTYIVPGITSSEHPGNNREDDREASSAASELINRAKERKRRSHRISAGSEGGDSEGEYLIDMQGNFILDGDGHKIPFVVPSSSYTDSDLDPEDYDGPPTTNPSGQNMPSSTSAP